MNALIGFVAGYLLGAKSGPQSLEEMRKAWVAIQASDEFQGLVAMASAYFEQAVQSGGASLTEALGNLSKLGGGQAVEQLSSLAKGTGEANAIWATVAQSPEFQMLLARGLSLVDGVLQGATIGGERSSARERGM